LEVNTVLYMVNRQFMLSCMWQSVCSIYISILHRKA